MKQISLFCAAAFFGIAVLAADQPTQADQELEKYFHNETLALSGNCLSEINSLSDWKSHREEYRRELQEMLGLWPMPARTDLKPVVTGRLEREDFTVEKIDFQASPELYCTANLYLPKNISSRAPTILYACGHARSTTNGISLGNKGVYQTDGAWYARNGYVCLVLDTLLMGEVQGIHTGTRDHGLWWWNSRGYTPAGVEAWFGIRALDYLCTRPEVDTNRFGITGHSGGGAYSWTITALDDRIKAAAPMAGMADARSHILDGVIDHHCDCNFFINYYRWDFPQLAALAAPRPLLIGGTDKDQLFHLDGTLRIFERVQKIYQLYGAANQLGLIIAPGPHDEVPEMQLAAMRWFNRYLKHEETPVESAAKKFFAPIDLKVFSTLPTDSINTNIADTFVPLAKASGALGIEKLERVREKAFAGWPQTGQPLQARRVFTVEREGVRFSAWEFSSEHDVRLRLYMLESLAGAGSERVILNVLDQDRWSSWVEAMRPAFASELTAELASIKSTSAAPASLENFKNVMKNQNVALAFFAPRGVGLDAWSGDAKALTRIRRRFMLLGQTLDGMRVWDIRRAIQMLPQVSGDDRAPVELRAEGFMGVNALYAALFEPDVKWLELKQLPASHAVGPDYLGVLKIWDIPQALELEATRAKVQTK